MIHKRTVGDTTAGLVMSLVFAVALLAIQSVEFVLDSWIPEGGETAPITLRLPAFSVFRVHLGQPAELLRRQVIIGQGEVVEPNEDARLAAAYEQIRRDSQVGWSLGMLLVGLVTSMLLLTALQHIRGGSRLLRTQATLLSLVLLFAAGAKAFLLLTSLPAYYYPMPAVVLVTAFILGRRAALAVNIFSAVVFASLLGFDLSALVVLFTTSYAGTLFLRDRKKRRTIITAGSLSGWFGAMALLIMMLVFSGAINVHRELLNPDYSAVLAAVVSGVFSGVVGFLLIEPVGLLVGRVSPAKLIELQDLDNPLLKQIRDEAPGTWEHSRTAANLAEAAAAAIGADSLLVRVGAYVHDAGKSLNPGYFIENQAALGITNPHDELDPEVSADCIFDHVREGTALLRKHHVPEAIVEFAYTHHGTSLLEYFWVRNMKAGNPKELKEKVFRYPGMRPKTKETAILMLIDAVEAASRTVKDPSKQKFENLVQRILFAKLNQGQLDESGLTLADLKVITNTLVESLVNMYHARIEYPWQQTTQTGSHTTHTGPQPTATGPLPTQTGPQPAPSGAYPAQSGAPSGAHPAAQSGTHSGAHPVAQSGTPSGAQPVAQSEAQAAPQPTGDATGPQPVASSASPEPETPSEPTATQSDAPLSAREAISTAPPPVTSPPASRPRRRRNAITLSGVGATPASSAPPKVEENAASSDEPVAAEPAASTAGNGSGTSGATTSPIPPEERSEVSHFRRADEETSLEAGISGDPKDGPA